MNQQALMYLAERNIFGDCRRILERMVERYGSDLVLKNAEGEGVNPRAVQKLFGVACEELDLRSIDIQDIGIYCKSCWFDGLAGHLDVI